MHTITKRTKLQYRFKRLVRDTGWQFGGDTFLRKKSAGARILVYHGICQSDPLQFNTLFLTREKFEAQLRLYKKYFTLISLDDFYNRRFNEEKLNLCLSFDDGFANNHKYVLPLLEQYQVPATFFITGIRDAGYDVLWNDVLAILKRNGPAGFSFWNDKFYRARHGHYISAASGNHLGDMLRRTDWKKKKEFTGSFKHFTAKVDGDYWLQLTGEQIREMSRSKWVTIGSHGYFHNDFAYLPAELAEEEMRKSKTYLENLTGSSVGAIAFPYGSYTRESISLAKKTGYTQVLATGFLYPDDHNDSVLRERLTINPFISNINQMHANITGCYK